MSWFDDLHEDMHPLQLPDHVHPLAVGDDHDLTHHDRHLHDDGTELVLPYGCTDHAHVFFSQPEPLAGISSYRFEAFCLPSDPHLLVDDDGDGRPDHTAWGTRVVEVDPYTRDDGTVVAGHYRTVGDDWHWNNLSSHR